MSSPPTTHDSRTSAASDSTDSQDGDHGALERVAPTVAAPIRRTGFWTAIVLPFLYVPLLATGLSTAAETITFLGLLVINFVALYVGHAHRR